MNQNNIFILSSNLFRLTTFKKYFNLYNTKTNIKINVILDDRHLKNEEILCIKELGYQTYFVSDMINKTKNMFDNPQLISEITDKYGVSIKWLLFIYISKILGYNKSMIIDDDTLMLKPIDSWFKYENVIMREQLSAMSNRVKNVLSELYPYIDIEQLNKERMLLNSGQIIFTWDDTLFHHMNLAFSQPMLNFVNEGITKYADNYKKTRNVFGYYWVMEQYVYAAYFYFLKTQKEVKYFCKDVKLQTTKLKENFKLSRTIPSYIHYLPKDKFEFYDKYLPALDEFIKNNIRV